MFLHPIWPNRVFFSYEFCLFFRTRTFFTFRWSHNINFYSTDEPNQKLFNRPKHSGQLKSFNSIWTLFLAFSKHSNAFNSLSIYIFQFFLVWFVVLDMKFLSPQLAELNDLFIDIVRSVIYREPPVYIHLTYFFIYFFSYIIITRDERKKLDKTLNKID